MINLYPNGVQFNSPGSAQRHPGLKNFPSLPTLKGSYKPYGWVARPEQRDGRGERGEDIEHQTSFNIFNTFRPRPSSTQGVPPKPFKRCHQKTVSYKRFCTIVEPRWGTTMAINLLFPGWRDAKRLLPWPIECNTFGVKTLCENNEFLIKLGTTELQYTVNWEFFVLSARILESP